jgi:hypothetical protein
MSKGDRHAVAGVRPDTLRRILDGDLVALPKHHGRG